MEMNNRSIRWVRIGAYPLAFFHADVNRASELDVGAFREFKSAELGAKKVSVYGIEVLEEVRIHGASGAKTKTKK